MTTPLQPATRRLLTEAAAAAGITDPAHPLGLALGAMIDPLLDAKLDDLQAGIPNGIATLDANGRVPAGQLGAGVAGGVATLGGDGKVPAGQLPAATSAPMSVVKTTTTSRASTITPAADPDLAFATTVQPGSYKLDAVLLFAVAPGRYKLTGTAVATAVGITVGANDAGNTNFRNVPWGSEYGGQQGQAQSITGTLIVTTAGTVRLDWAQWTANATAVELRAGSYLRLERLG